MTPIKKGLQKFTESEKKINALMELNKISFEDTSKLNNEERLLMMEICTEKINTLKGQDRDELLYKLEDVMPLTIKNQLWENNHIKISIALSKLMQDYGIMPTRNQLADETGLSRQTIFNHLKEYSSNPLYLKDVEQFKLLSNKVLAKVFKYAVNGDLKACRLYFDVVGGLNNQFFSSVKDVQQNNYIQINNTVLSQDELKQLNEDQLTQIETVLKGIISPVLIEKKNKSDNVSDNKI